MQLGDWRVQSQSASIRRIMQDWKPSSDMYHHCGATKPIPQLRRHALTFRKALEWLSTPSQNPITLESLVISGFSGFNHSQEPTFDLLTIDKCLFLNLRHLTLDFRIRNESSLHPRDATWLCNAIRLIVTSSRHVETLDLVSPNTRAKLRLELLTVFDLSVQYVNLKEVCLAFVAFDDEQLHLFLDHLKNSMQRLTIECAVFNHATSWKVYVLSDTDGRPLVEKHEPSQDQLIDYWLRAWELPEVPQERRRKIAEGLDSDWTEEILASVREVWWSQEHDELFQLEWPEHHVFGGGKGTYECTNGVATVIVEWPQNWSG
jgi:hypothetical protein